MKSVENECIMHKWGNKPYNVFWQVIYHRCVFWYDVCGHKQVQCLIAHPGLTNEVLSTF